LYSSGKYMTIHVEELTLSSIIGILDFERVTPQSIVINILIDYYYLKENNFINYAEVIQLVEELIETRKYKLLEDALTEIQEKLLSTYPEIQKLSLKISKPDIISNANVALSVKWSIKK